MSTSNQFAGKIDLADKYPWLAELMPDADWRLRFEQEACFDTMTVRIKPAESDLRRLKSNMQKADQKLEDLNEQEREQFKQLVDEHDELNWRG